MKKFIITLVLVFAAISSSYAQYDVNNDEGKVTVTGDGGKQIVNIVQEPQSDRLLVEVLGMKLQLRNGDSQKAPRPTYVPKFKPHGGHLALIELGYNYVQNQDYYYLEMMEVEDYDFLGYKSWKSLNINMTLSKISVDLERNGLASLTFGYQSVFHFQMLPNNIRLEKHKGMIVPVKADEPYKNSYIFTAGFRIPVIVELNDLPRIFGAKESGKKSNWFMSCGLHLDILSSMAVTRKPNTTERNIYNNSLQLGINARIGWGNYYVYMTRNITNVFKEDRGPFFNTSTVGIGFLF